MKPHRELYKTEQGELYITLATAWTVAHYDTAGDLITRYIVTRNRATFTCECPTTGKECIHIKLAKRCQP